MIIISWAFPCLVAVYLVVLLRVMKKVARDHQVYWEEIGSPSWSDPKGQMIILSKFVFGFKLSKTIEAEYKNSFTLLRTTCALSVVSFIIITVLMFAGAYEV